MLLSKKPIIIDPSQPEDKWNILPHPPILSSHAAGWNGFYLAHHRQPSWETPEVSNLYNLICIRLKNPELAEIITEEDRQTVRDITNSPIQIYPPDLRVKIRTIGYGEFVYFCVSPQFLSKVAHESVNPDRAIVDVTLEAARSAHFSDFVGTEKRISN